VYRVSAPAELLEAAARAGIVPVRLALQGCAQRAALFARFAEGFAFPSWFGANWDALEDCLADLSWRTELAHVLLLERVEELASDDRGVLLDVLSSVAGSWAERGTPFFAVLVDPHDALGLPALEAPA
jgi:hypothetical protein